MRNRAPASLPSLSQPWRGLTLLLLVTLATLWGAGSAHAQTTTPPSTSTASVTLATSGFIVRRDPERASGEYPYWLNRKDCLDDDLTLAEPGAAGDAPERAVIQITPTLRGFNSTMNLEVWIGTTANCTDQAERRTATGRCWQVYSQAPTQSGQTISIRPRQVIAEKPAADAAANAWEDISTCDKGTDRRNITFYIMLLKGGDNGDVIGTAATWDKTNIDIAAPPPPDTLEISPGDQRLFAKWNVPIANDLEDTQGFRFYCEPVGAGAGQGGTTGQGGGGGAVASGCGSLLQPGMSVDTIKRQRCGSSTGRTARTGQAVYFINEDGSQGAPLENGTSYALGVTTGDLVFNESKLSEVVCASPEQVTTFFEGYRDAGGQGGGGFCGFSPRSASDWGWLSAAAVGGVWFLRRRRQRA